MQGDTLFIERPYAKPSSSGLCSLEYAPGTILSVSPYTPQEVETLYNLQENKHVITAALYLLCDKFSWLHGACVMHAGDCT